MSIRILLADDHALLREGLRALLSTQGELEVVGEAADGLSAVEAARRLCPDVIVMDVTMPGLSGPAATRQICRDCHDTTVVALSAHSDSRHVSQMLEAGALAYVVKAHGLDELVHAIRTAYSGRTYLSPEVTGTVVEGYLSSVSTDLPVARLSERELEVLQLVAEGKSSKEIGPMLHVSPRTVDSHRQRIMEKLELYTVAELTKYAIREGLTPVEA